MRILIPVKGTPESEAPTVVAEQFGREFDAEIYLLRVVEWIDAFSGLRFDPDVLRMMEDAARYVDKLASRLDLPADRVHALVSWSDNVASEIINVAQNEDIDLIVMGTSRKGTVQRLLQGSVHRDVLHSQVCPVMCVPVEAAQVTSRERVRAVPRSSSARNPDLRDT